MKNIVLLVLAYVMFVAQAQGVDCKNVSSLDNLYHASISDSIDISNRMFPDIEKMEKFINEVDFDKGVSMIEAMTKEQVSEYAVIEDRLKVNQMAQLISSRRERDIWIMINFISLVEDVYSGARFDDFNMGGFSKFTNGGMYDDILKGKDVPYKFIYASLVLGMIDIKSLSENNLYMDEVCNEVAFLNKKKMAYDARAKDFSVDLINEYMQFAKNMRKKYKNDAIDNEVFNDEEKSLFAHYKSMIVEPFQKLSNVVRSYEIAKILLKINNDIYKYDMGDVYLYSGDNDKLGTTMAKRVKEGLYNDVEESIIGFWRRMNDLVPTPIVKDMYSANQ